MSTESISKCAFELEIGDIILNEHPILCDKRPWKVLEKERIGSRFFIKIEVLPQEIQDPYRPKIEYTDTGNIWKLDCGQYNCFTVKANK